MRLVVRSIPQWPLSIFLVLCLELISSVGFAEESPPVVPQDPTLWVNVLRDFSHDDPSRLLWVTESGNSLTVGQGSGDHPFFLTVPVLFPQPRELWLNQNIQLVQSDFSRSRPPVVTGSLSLRVYLPAESKGRNQIALLLKDKDGLFFQGTFQHPLRPGSWNTVIFDLSPGSLQIIPVGHYARWNLDRLSSISRIGFSLWGDQDLSTELQLSRIETRPHNFTREEIPPLQVVNLNRLTQEPRVGELLEFSFTVNRPLLNPFNQNEIKIDAVITPAGTGKSIRVPCFYYQDYTRSPDEPADRYTPEGPGQFRLRYTPVIEGDHSLSFELFYQSLEVNTLEGNQMATTMPLIVKIKSQAFPGYIQISHKDPRYFEFQDGTFFYPVGHNFRSPSDQRDWNKIQIQKDPNASAPKDRGLKIYEEYLPRSREAGENLIEVWMSSWWLALEWSEDWKGFRGLNHYSQENAFKLDELLSLCSKLGIYIHLVIDNHGKAGAAPQADHEWAHSPYNKASQRLGFLSQPEELFASNPQVTAHYQNILRYISARWGYSPSIFAFEMWSELDLTGSKMGRHREIYAHENVRRWHQEMIRYFSRVNGSRHMVTTHYSGDYSVIDRKMVALPEISYLACDAYHEQNKSLITLLQETDQFAREYAKPYLITEFGGSPYGGTWEELEGDLHAGLWTSWMTNAGGTSLFWWFEHINRASLYSHFKALANFIKGEDKRRGAGQVQLAPLPLLIVKKEDKAPLPELAGLTLGDDRILYGWIYSKMEMQRLPAREIRINYPAINLIFPTKKDGVYLVEFWDTTSGIMMKTAEFCGVESGLCIELPAFTSDIAFKLRRK